MSETGTAITDSPHIVGYWCPSMPDGPLIPPRALRDPCGRDVPVWSDGHKGERDDGREGEQ